MIESHDSEPAITDRHTFVLVHGGAHDGSAWRQIVERLEQFGHTAFAPTAAGHGKGVPKNVTHAESTQSIVDFILDGNLVDFVLVGHGYGGTLICKVAEAIPERIRRLVFWSALIPNDGETALELLPDDPEPFAKMAAESGDNTFMIPFDAWRDAFINDGDPDLVERAYSQLSPQPYGPWVEPLDMKKFYTLTMPRSFLVGTEDLVLPPGESGWHPRMSKRLGTFRLVEMPGSHEALFAKPIVLADKIIEAGRD